MAEQTKRLAKTLDENLNVALPVESLHKDSEGNVLDENGNVIIDKDGNVQKKNGDKAVLTDEEGNMLVGLMDVPFSQLSAYLTQSAETVELGTLLSSKTLNMLNPESQNYDLYMLLCYGEKTDYERDENGRVVLDEHKKAVMKNGAKATTVGDFLAGNGASSGSGSSGGIVSVLEKVTVSGLLDATGSLNNDNALMRALLYGTEGKDYTYDETTGEVSWLPLSYELDEADNFIAPDGTSYLYDPAAAKWTDAEGNYIVAASAIRAAAFRSTANATAAPSSYAYKVYSKEGTLICQLAAKSGSDRAFTAHGADGATQFHKPLSVKNLMDTLGGNGNVVDLLGDVELGTLLGLNEKEYTDDNKIIFSLAYGSKGIDFEIIEGKVVMLNGAKPATVSALIDNPMGLLDSVALDSVMTIGQKDNVMRALAYGTDGLHYTWAEGEAAPEMLPVKYTLKDGFVYDENGNVVEAAEGASGIYAVKMQSGEIRYAKADADNGASLFLYETKDCTGEKLRYQKRSLGELLDSGESLLSEVELGSLMGLNAESDPILLSLAYGSEGVDYVIKDGSIVMLGDKKPTTVGDLTDGDAASDLVRNLQLGAIFGVSPLDGGSDPLLVEIAYGIEGTNYELKDGKIVWLPNGEEGLYSPRIVGDLQDRSFIDDIHIYTLLNINADSSEIMLSLAYGNPGENYEIVESNGVKNILLLNGAKPRTIKDLRDGSLIDQIRLTSLLTANTDDAITMYLLYGVKGTDYEMIDGKVVMLEGKQPRTIGDLSDGKLFSDITKDLTVGELAGKSDSKLLSAVKDWHIDDLNDQNKIMSLKISDVMEIDETNSPAILKAMKDWTLDDLNDQEKIDSLRICDILSEKDLDENNILRHLKNSTVRSLSSDLEALKISEIFETDVYKTIEDGEAVWFVDKDGNKLYRTTQEPADEALKARRVLTGTWKYLLVDPETGKEDHYTITNMNLLVSNMTKNIQGATMDELYKDGIIVPDDADFLQNEIKYEFYFGGSKIAEVTTRYYEDEEMTVLKTKVGQLTISELLNYVSEVVSLF